jgi:hypothetical protein
MMIKWASVLEEYPKLEFAHPIITESMKQQAEKNIPIPAHCRPWLDAQSAGLVIRWPHKEATITVSQNMHSHFVDTPEEYAETVDMPGFSWTGESVGRFAPWHFSLLPHYIFRTPPGIGLYVVGLPDDYSSPIDQRLVVRGVLETDWYSLPPFFVYKIPVVYGETTFVIRTGDPICMVVPIVLHPTHEEMTHEELREQTLLAKYYDEERIERDDLLWYSKPFGQMFSRLYKEKSRQYRQHLEAGDSGGESHEEE